MNTFNTDQLIGKTLEEAEAILQPLDMHLRITYEDGVSQMCTCDYRTDRVDVSLAHNKITAAFIG